MNNTEFQLRGVGDPRLAVHATSAFPAWLWSIDGMRVLWANPVAARLFGAGNGAALASKIFSPADAHRRQVAQLAGKLSPSGAMRLERLRGFGAPLGTLVTCGCARLDFADGSHGILVTAEAAARTMPLVERLQHLVEGIESPIAAFTPNGVLVAANTDAPSLLGFRNLSEAGLDDARNDVLRQGRVEVAVGDAQMVLHRVGVGADLALVALITPGTGARVACERPMISGEAPAEFALIDEFMESPSEPAAAEAVPDQPPGAIEASASSQTAAPLSLAPPAQAPSWLDDPSPNGRRHPLRFMWQMDAEGRFALGSDEFTRLIGAHTAASFGRLWSEIAEVFGLDPDDRILKAAATRNTWSGITLNWPIDGGGRLPVELSGLPVYDRTGNFAGYRGFGVCRDLDGLARLAALRRHELFSHPPMPRTLSADIHQVDLAQADLAESPPAVDLPAAVSVASSDTPQLPAAIVCDTSPPPNDLETSVEPSEKTLKEAPKNVLPFRPIEPKSPALTAVENSAFDELARQLSARLDKEKITTATPATADAPETVVERAATPDALETPEPAIEPPGWLADPEPPARGQGRRDKMLLDLLPVGVLIYRLDRLLYANPAFLERIGYPNLHALEEAGALDALYVEPGVSTASSTSDTGTPVTISARQASSEHAPSPAADARLFTISWDDDSALALIFSNPGTESAGVAIAEALPASEPLSEPSAGGQADAEELGAILDTAVEGVVMFNAEGHINSCNRSAEALFGYDGADLAQRNLAELFAPESQRVVMEYLEGIKGTGVESLLDHGREALGRVCGGGLIPLSITMGRTKPESPNFFAVFRDLSQSKKSESELQTARRLADRAANAKADMLARISHEVRTPLNAIIGFSEVMIGERFGALGNERYVEYMKDIRASGERVIAIIDDLLDLSRIETGKLDLAFANQNLNELVESGVAVMQPQANRERIIIRTSLAHMLPPVVADARALRQIVLNLIGNSIHLANAGGQVIVSTALSDFGEVVLRVRDTGHGLNDNEVAAAMEPFRTQAPSDQASDSSGVSLSLTKALVEANRAQFHIKTGGHSGTLIEVVFAQAMAKV
jgi:PAS domain S-box-containing protein